ncbi:MAG: DUF4097 domain-containing protein [Lactobacillaceae bacterium]|jgi:hypothetical protein|nr:DUF4097 domain-containing protein [Lactobacillaceae bacterium]
MKLKKFLIIGATTAVIGGMLMGGSFVSGANLYVGWQDGPKLIKQNSFTKDLEGKNFKVLDLKISGVNLDVVQGDEWNVSTKYSLTKPLLKIKGSTLSVTFSDQGGLINGTDKNRKIIITVPKNSNLDKLKMVSNYNSTVMKKIKANTYNLSTTSANLSLYNLDGQNMKLNASLGGTINGSEINLSKLDLNQGYSYVTLSKLTLLQASTITNDQGGDLVLNQLSVPGLNIKTNNVVAVDGFGENTASKKGIFTSGDQKNPLSIDTLGSVTISAK